MLLEVEPSVKASHQNDTIPDASNFGLPGTTDAMQEFREALRSVTKTRSRGHRWQSVIDMLHWSS